MSLISLQDCCVLHVALICFILHSKQCSVCYCHLYWHLKSLLYGGFILNLVLCVWVFFIRDGLHYDSLVKNVPVFIIQDRYHTWRNSDTVNPAGLIAAVVMERGYFSDLLKYYFILISDFFGGVLTNTSSCCFTFCSTSFLKIYTFSVIIIVNCRLYIVSEKI